MEQEPGTGTQVHTFANHYSDVHTANGRHINGTYWKCGHDYLDTELADVCELSYIIGKSTWCDTSPAREQPPRLVFTYERRGGPSGEVEVDPLSIDVNNRFIERYSEPAPEYSERPW